MKRTAERARILALGAALVAGAARAEPPGPQGATAPATQATTAAPEAVFGQGLASFEAKRFAEAIATWEGLVRALGEERGFKVLYNLGLAYEAEGDATRAIERFEGFLRHLAAQPAELTRDLEERRQDAAERTRAMKATRGAVVVPAPAGHACAVRIDGAAARPAGFTAYLAPGAHAIEVFAGSPEARTVRILVEAGRPVSVDTTPPVRPGGAGAAEPRPELPTAWVIGGGTLAVLSFALPLGLGLHAADLRAGAEALGRGHTMYPDAARRFEDVRAAYLASYAAPAVLGAATLALVAAFVVRLRLHENGARGAGVALSMSPGGVWLRGDL